ncbi:MAG: Nif3-like dinuclear metal center hexameric protein [Bacteroidetes bacterium]|nr:Nif3-like dinuclear metal center hexameric protein [Bacteroidota bacterium]
MKLTEIISFLEQVAPPSYQETYDNSGLIYGYPEMDIKAALICLDSTEAIVDEAIKTDCNLIIAHHPIVFSGIRKLNGKNYVERTLIKAIKNDIAIYAIHTNLDNVAAGVNREICDRLGLQNPKILQPKSGLLKKLVTFAPTEVVDKVKNALFAAGAGSIGNYDECSFSLAGTGTFRGNEQSKPVIGVPLQREELTESRIEVLFESRLQTSVLHALRDSHPYEEIAFDIYSIDNQHQNVGSGMIGELPAPLNQDQFLKLVKESMKTACIRYTASSHEKISKVAVCGGSGSFLVKDALSAGAQAFITADFKYHQFFDGEGRLLIADIGHYESEQFTKDLIYKLLTGKFTTFAVRLSELNTNPINYF